MLNNKKPEVKNNINNTTNQTKLTGSFGSYFVWRGMINSYMTLKKSYKANGKLESDKKRLIYLQKQIVWNFFKDFFLFPIWILRFLKPAYMKGPITLWDNLKTITKATIYLIRSHEFKPLRIAVLSQICFIFIFVQFGILMLRFYSIPTYAATYGFVQTDWSGGASTTVFATHATNQSGWTYYYSKDSSITTAVPGEVSLVLNTNTSTDTTDSDFSTNTTLTNIYVPSSTDSFQLLKQNGATCSVASECVNGGCNGSSLCYTP